MSCEAATLWLAIGTTVATLVIAATGVVYTIVTVRLWRTTRDALKLNFLQAPHALHDGTDWPDRAV